MGILVLMLKLMCSAVQSRFYPFWSGFSIVEVLVLACVDCRPLPSAKPVKGPIERGFTSSLLSE